MSKQVGEYDDFVRAEILAARVAELEDVLREIAEFGNTGAFRRYFDAADDSEPVTIPCGLIKRARRLVSDIEDDTP